MVRCRSGRVPAPSFSSRVFGIFKILVLLASHWCKTPGMGSNIIRAMSKKETHPHAVSDDRGNFDAILGRKVNIQSNHGVVISVDYSVVRLIVIL